MDFSTWHGVRRVEDRSVISTESFITGKWKSYPGKDITYILAGKQIEEGVNDVYDFKSLSKNEVNKADSFIKDEILTHENRILGMLITGKAKKE